MKGLKIQSTVYPVAQEKILLLPNVSIADMERFWKKNGNFNMDLYRKISNIKLNC